MSSKAYYFLLHDWSESGLLRLTKRQPTYILVQYFSALGLRIKVAYFVFPALMFPMLTGDLWKFQAKISDCCWMCFCESGLPRLTQTQPIYMLIQISAPSIWSKGCTFRFSVNCVTNSTGGVRIFKTKHICGCWFFFGESGLPLLTKRQPKCVLKFTSDLCKCQAKLTICCCVIGVSRGFFDSPKDSQPIFCYNISAP